MTDSKITHIKPVALRRMLPQAIRGLSLGRDHLCLDTKEGVMEVPLHDARIEQGSSWFFFKHLTITSSYGSFRIDGITQDAAQAVERAIQEAKRRQDVLVALRSQSSLVAAWISAWETLVTRDLYLTASDVEQWSRGVGQYVLPEDSDTDLIDKLPEHDAATLRRLVAVRANTRAVADQRNAVYTQEQLEILKPFFDTVESQPLTENQRLAVVHDEDSALVIAGAGTGKTSCVVAKVGFILKKGWAKPEKILLLAFTRKAAEEMQERLKTRLGVEVKVRTFHALGLEIVANATGNKPSLCVEAEDAKIKLKTLTDIITTHMSDEAFRSDYLAFLVSPRRMYVPLWEFKSEEEYVQYRLDVELRTLSGRKVKSYEEFEIANWLLVNGIRFEYETTYEVVTATADHRQYKPDFYLTDYGIYIEHWGVDKANRTAHFMDQTKYLEKMTWARETHKTNNTKLVETYSWERQEKVLLTSLEAKLREHGVELAPISMDDALEVLNKEGRIDPFSTLLGSFISHFKSAGGNLKGVQEKVGKGGDATRDALFLRLFEKLFTSYQSLLHGRGEIDFDDMIVLARQHVDDGSYRSPFRYILVDEFQDIALGRANLIHSLKKQAVGAKLFCVGDDWQSIYRFSGSNITLTTEFDKYFGYTKKTMLDRTFRFHDKLSGFSAHFVQKNPSQLPKQLSTNTTASTPGVSVLLGEETSSALTTVLTDIAKQGPASVLLLGRYHHTLPDKAALATFHSVFPDLDIRAMTAHASKGLEADYVLVCDVNRGKYGFPSEIADDPVLAMVLPESERFPFAEERRLFYVALTRARKHVYLLADAANPSAFISEILREQGYEKVVIEIRTAVSTVCPFCQRGKVGQIKGGYGSFYGCSNYPICTYKGVSCTRCNRGWLREVDASTARCTSCDFIARRCPRCMKGMLIGKSGRFGAFLGCSNFRRELNSCDYTERLSK